MEESSAPITPVEESSVSPTTEEEPVHFQIADTPPAQVDPPDEVYDLLWKIDGFVKVDGSRKIF